MGRRDHRAAVSQARTNGAPHCYSADRRSHQFAKTQLFHTGAGDTVDCVLLAGATAFDEASMKTLPALASIPVSMHPVTTTSPTQLSVTCDVLTAGGTADSSSLIAIPIG
jgi:hypothetical protein